MLRSARPLLPFLLGLAACAGPGAPGAPGNAALAYHPGDDAHTYLFADTTAFAIEAGGMGTMRVLSAQSGVAEVAFAPGEDVMATIRLLDYSARFENPNQGATTVDERAVDGAWVVRVTPRGQPTVVDSPAISVAGREIIGVESAVRPFFVYLPGRPASAGASWVDTVSVTEAHADAISTARSIITSTLEGDTIVDRRRLLVISTISETTLEVEGSSGGVEIFQSLSGATRGRVLWDADRGVLVDRVEEGRLDGTLELPGMGFGGLPVEATVRRTARLSP